MLYWDVSSSGKSQLNEVMNKGHVQYKGCTCSSDFLRKDLDRRRMLSTLALEGSFALWLDQERWLMVRLRSSRN